MKNAPFSAACALLVLGLTATSALAQAPEEEGETPDELSSEPETEPSPPPAGAASETSCDDRQDDDGDGMIDCADADCFEHARCHAGGEEERTDQRCSDWIDNDGDGAVDCEDDDCSAEHITVCRGSWSGRPAGAGHGAGPEHEVPELTGNMSVEDLIGRGSDADGERNDYTCSDGVDNDGDGRTDCQDFGCRFDPR
ncbi:MAG: hypothetical protein M5U28_21645 [Sandaracinaceae bacterium]|nr:hypothetical protein [Sandaracinaceae bacterium]